MTSDGKDTKIEDEMIGADEDGNDEVRCLGALTLGSDLVAKAGLLN